jgi:hypothetical protein
MPLGRLGASTIRISIKISTHPVSVFEIHAEFFTQISNDAGQGLLTETKLRASDVQKAEVLGTGSENCQTIIPKHPGWSASA